MAQMQILSNMKDKIEKIAAEVQDIQKGKSSRQQQCGKNKTNER